MPDRERTNAMRLLDAKGVSYVAHTFSSTIHSAEGVAEVLGFPARRVFKTLVVLPTTRRARPILAIVPGDGTLDLKKLAHAAGEKKLRMATQREAESLTGLQVGGISALALLNKGFVVYLDATANEGETLLVSAGTRGINLEMAAKDLTEVTGARVRDISQQLEEE